MADRCSATAGGACERCHGSIRLVDRKLPGEVAKAATVLGDRQGVVSLPG